MSEIVWEDPPEPATGRKGVWFERLSPLMEKPGEWARVLDTLFARTAYGTVTVIKQGKSGTRSMNRPPGQWEACARKVDGKFYVYARYLGPEKKGRGK